jgi:serine/threonine-protein kinase
MLTQGTILQNRYQIVRLLGAGGMGAVYLAYDLRLGNRLVVVKENIGGDAQQFQIEANILAVLSHPNLPRVGDHFTESSGAQYLVMDYVEGQNLEEIVQQCGALAEKDALAWMAQIFDAVKYLHANRIIHRDIKPQNIIITPQGKAVLVDFGIAKIHVTGSPTMSGARSLGSPGFAPPEQYSGGTDERSDVYALGATLYFLLTACVPQDAPSRAAGTLLTPPRTINSAILPNTDAVITAAMHLNASQRYASVSEMGQMLYAVPPTIPVPTSPSPTGFRARDLRVIVLILLMLLIALITTAIAVGVGYFAARDATPPVISEIDPPDGAVLPSNPRVVITAMYTDSRAIAVTSVRLTLDGRDVTAHATISETSLSYAADLDPGLHIALLEVRDTAGNKVSRAWQFTLALPSDKTATPLPPFARAVTIARPTTPAPLPVETLPAGTCALPGTYTVAWGDWLNKIAQRFGITTQALLAANPGVNPNRLYPGQVLRIPCPGAQIPETVVATPSAGCGTTYTSQRGEWFYAIARQFGVSVSALQAANPGINPNLLSPGQVLNIPCVESPGMIPAPRSCTYTVQRGDTLASIAVRFHTTMYALQIANHLPNAMVISPGQVLLIPDCDATPAETATPTP